MRIKIRELKQQLNTEIQLMDRKSSECRQWLSRFSVFDLQSYELQGEAYTALTSRIHSHSEFLRSQSLLFDAVKKVTGKTLLRWVSCVRPNLTALWIQAIWNS